MGCGSEALVAGVDGCRRGWAVVTAAATGAASVQVELLSTFDALVGRLQRDELAVVSIDMPIGLAEDGPRGCDVQARARLGRRASTVFPAPVRAVLGSADHAEACRRSRAASGRGLSIQAFNLVPKIAELDRCVPLELSDRVVEAHPELAFLRLAEGAELAPKRTVLGRRQRLDLVAQVLAPGFDLEAASLSAGVPVGDALDAAVLVATARRLWREEACVLGGELDVNGRPMRVAW